MPRGLDRDRVVRNYSVGNSTTSENEAEARKNALPDEFIDNGVKTRSM